MLGPPPVSPTPLSLLRFGELGPSVVFLHGLFGQGRNWSTVAKALAPEFRTVLPDLPDHGRSGWSAEVSYPAMAARVAALLSPTDPAFVVGHSMGGKVAMTLALTRPELVRGLVVVDISPVGTERMSGFAGYVAAMRSLDLSTLADRASADAALAPQVPDVGVRGFLLQNLRRDATGWRWQHNLALLGDRLDVLGGWPDLGAPPYRGPVLWLAGGRSDYVRPEHAPTMRRLFPRARLVTVRDASHWVHSEQPEVVTATLRRFLASASEAAGET